MKETDFWSFHLEYLKIAIALSTAVIAAAAAIYVDETKIPTDFSKYWLFSSIALFALMLICSTASLGLLGNHMVTNTFENNADKVKPSSSNGLAVHCANGSFTFLILAVISLTIFLWVRTWAAERPTYERAIALAKSGLQLDPTKNETASLKTLDLQGSTYQMTFALAPGGGIATVVTDDKGTTLKSAKRP